MSQFERDVLWVAGLLEGEGCFIFQTQLKIVLQMTDEDIVVRARDILRPGGHSCYVSIPMRANRKPLYSFVITGPQAAGWMMMLYPFMGERRKAKIQEVLALWRNRLAQAQYRYRCPQGHVYDKTMRGKRHCRACRAMSQRKCEASRKRDTQTASMFEEASL